MPAFDQSTLVQLINNDPAVQAAKSRINEIQNQIAAISALRNEALSEAAAADATAELYSKTWQSKTRKNWRERAAYHRSVADGYLTQLSELESQLLVAQDAYDQAKQNAIPKAMKVTARAKAVRLVTWPEGKGRCAVRGIFRSISVS